MADRRMFSKTIIDSDAFLDMPLSTQSLYFHLGMRADDEGFINNPKKIQRMIGATEDDLKLLIAKKFIIPFETGIVVIKHWRIHNYIRADRLVKTTYDEERKQLIIKDNGAYSLPSSGQSQPGDGQVTVKCQSSDGQVTDNCPSNVSIGKDSIGKDSIGKDRIESDKRYCVTKSKGDDQKGRAFSPPSLAEVKSFVAEKNLVIDAEQFFFHYYSKDWTVGGEKLTNWKAKAKEWDRKDRANERKSAGSAVRPKSGSYDGIGGLEV